MVYTRGASDDYDRLARVSGDDGWSWSKMVPYFLRVRSSSVLRFKRFVSAEGGVLGGGIFSLSFSGVCRRLLWNGKLEGEC